MPANRLARESSPYLLQHKDNPVDWYPWGSEALDLAREADKPILLSVGYAACHWCHVMAHESFEHPDIAALMNDLFINIKVDREERPDLDTVYQTALALLGEHGGWPLTMFLTPRGEPFWGGTYFPSSPRFGRPGFPDILRGIAKAYHEQPAEVAQNVAAIKDALHKVASPAPAGQISLDSHLEAAKRLAREIDPFEGGLGHAPKFPQPTALKLLWRAWLRSGQPAFRQGVDLTLTKMSQGGIYDHLGGGFARYAVDEKWLVPHFEKMLYDNAQLVQLLTWAWQSSGDALYAQRVEETVGWLLRDMLAEESPGGPRSSGFASSFDADSEGEEGKYYVWTAAEIDALLGDEAAAFKAAYDVRPEGNWEGKTILNRSARPNLGSEAEEARLAQARARLLAARSRRPAPAWDDKVLADWNGLAIAALAEAGAAFRRPEWRAAAEGAFAFLVGELQPDGRLRHSWRHGTARHPATLDDYANLSLAALTLYEIAGGDGYLQQAEAWVAVLDAQYWDAANGGYFLTAADTNDLPVRPKSAHDSAVPSGNGTMAEVLARLAYLTGRAAYRERAEALIAAFSGELARNPFALATLLNGSETLNDAIQIVIVGKRGQADTEALLAAVHATCLPTRVLQVIDDPGALPAGHPAAGKAALDGRATAYVCRGPTCSLPITTAQALKQALWACRG